MLRHAVAHSATWSYALGMSAQPVITQRDLRQRSREIMDAVEGGQSFIVTRDGRSIGALVPLERRRRFVPRAEFAAMSRNAPEMSLNAFRTDQGHAADQELDDPYGR
jgi:prevent-host-death family protein